MSHLPDLISDLALILISAGIITLLFKWLKQPLVLGYIVAGLLAGPYVQIFPTVVDVENINLWAEMGVVFLLFALGLEFSFKKLMNVGSTAFITAMTEVITMLIVGYLVGHLLGWSTMNSICVRDVGRRGPGCHYYDGLAFNDGGEPGVCRGGNDRQYPEGRLFPDSLVSGRYIYYSGFPEKGEETDE